MGDVLPPKRQTVVDRLRRRFESYRRHQNSCLPRYEQATNSLYETQRQETLLLKQRFLESKAKKAKNTKNDHHRSNAYKEPTPDGQKAQQHIKPVKRPAEDSAVNSITDPANEESEKPAKIAKNETSSDKSSQPPSAPPAPVPKTESQTKSSLPSFSVQIVQQFTNTSQSHLSQTIQTNVTVKTLSGSSTKAPDPSDNSQSSVTVTQESQISNPKETQKPLPSDPVTEIVECKQEKENEQPELCQYTTTQTSNTCGGGDRLSDTFPSLGFTDDSGDEIIHPDIFKDLIDDVFTNSADIMKDFNFEDSVSSVKDPDVTAKEIIELVKDSAASDLGSFHAETLTFVDTHAEQHQQQNSIFDTSPTKHIVTTSGSTATTSTTYYANSSQRLSPYGVSGIALPTCLGLDFKLTEPSPAALTLKQMAEQHQNMQQKQQQQQQQIVTSPMNNRPPPFAQDTFNMNTMRSNYLNGSNSPMANNNSPKTPNATNLFNSFDHINNYPGIKPISPNMFKQEVLANSPGDMVMPETDHSKRLQLGSVPRPHPKPPAYGSTRTLPHFHDDASSSIGHQSNHHPHMQGNLFPGTQDIRLQMNPSQQMHMAHHNAQQVHANSPDVKQQQQNMVQPHSNLYGYSQQQGPNSLFHVSMSQSMTYSSQFNSNPVLNRPPPEYKTHHSNMPSDNIPQDISSQLNLHHLPKSNYFRQQKASNVVIGQDSSGLSPSASNDWRQDMLHQQPQGHFRMGPYPPTQENYGNLIRSDQMGSRMQMYNQYRMSSGSVPLERIPRTNVPTHHQMILQQRQRMVIPQRSRNSSMTEMNNQHASVPLDNNSVPVPHSNPLGTLYNTHQDMSRQDGSQITLDFLDNIESSASDFLNFDQVMQSGNTHFQLLDDMEILGK